MKTIIWHATIVFVVFVGGVALTQCAQASKPAYWYEMPTCSWARPGASPYKGDLLAAVDKFSIPEANRAAIKQAMLHRQTTSVLRFTRDTVRDDHGNSYRPDMTPMVFGINTICWQPSRAKWKEGQFQEADLFCDDGYCIAVPYVCGNVTQVFPIDQKQFDDGPQAPAGFVPPAFGPGYGQDGPGYFPGRTETFHQWWTRWFGGGGGGGSNGSQPVHTVPEPGTFALMALGLAGIVAFRKKAKTGRFT